MLEAGETRNDVPPISAGPPREDIAIHASRGLGAWLTSRNVCLLVSSYQSGRLIAIGADRSGRVVVHQKSFDRAMGMAVRGDSLLVSTLHQLWRFRLCRQRTKEKSDNDRMLVPQASYHTAFVNCHDVAWIGGGVPIFASSLFNCVGMVTPESSFVPLWAPEFITDLVPQDQCHLNGVAVDDGRLRFVTALSGESGNDAWRRDRSKGVVIDVQSGRIVVRDLWMPHSPRIHDRKLWLHVSGRGSFGLIEGGDFVEKLACPGYTRGLDFQGSVAAIGLSKLRPGAIPGLPLRDRLETMNVDSSCAVLLFDTAANRVIHWMRFVSMVEEIYDVTFLPGTSNLKLVHPASTEASRVYCIAAAAKARRVRHDSASSQLSLSRSLLS